jgi:hypothetical protein
MKFEAPVAQLDRASASGAEGYRFKSCRAYFGKRDRAFDPRLDKIGRTEVSQTVRFTCFPGGPRRRVEFARVERVEVVRLTRFHLV